LREAPTAVKLKLFQRFSDNVTAALNLTGDPKPSRGGGGGRGAAGAAAQGDVGRGEAMLPEHAIMLHNMLVRNSNGHLGVAAPGAVPAAAASDLPPPCLAGAFVSVPRLRRKMRRRPGTP
jgi:hypothetical protein